MSDTITDQTQKAHEVQPQTAAQEQGPEKTAENDKESGEEKFVGVGEPGPKKLLSHFKGMPKQWEKNNLSNKECKSVK
ncbi:hypothetical protein GGR57DRAFT_409584 [Xylariaceae sp. FL1272]|nr:hypothetical protein GGR57DRAFT_409584 [Xylariaceae sp. FL1272]